MKIIKNILVLLCLCVILTGCPFSSPYTLDDSPSINVEDELLGNWATFVKRPNSSKAEPVKLILTKKNETEYNIAFIGFLKELRNYRKEKSDSITGTAFMSTVGVKQFFNISIKSQNYIAELRLKDDKLSLLPLVEHFTAKMIRNNLALRKSVEFHYKTRVHPMLDDDFCLKDMIRVN